MIILRTLILNNKGSLLIDQNNETLSLPQKVCYTNENCSSFEESAFNLLKEMYNIEDVLPNDFYLYCFFNKIEAGEVFLDVVYKSTTKLRKLNGAKIKARFMEIREIKKDIDLFTDEIDQQVLRRFIIREDNPTFL